MGRTGGLFFLFAEQGSPDRKLCPARRSVPDRGFFFFFGRRSTPGQDTFSCVPDRIQIFFFLPGGAPPDRELSRGQGSVPDRELFFLILLDGAPPDPKNAKIVYFSPFFARKT